MAAVKTATLVRTNGHLVRVLFAETLAERETGLVPYGPAFGMFLTDAHAVTMRETDWPLALVWLAPSVTPGHAVVERVELAIPRGAHPYKAPPRARAVVELPPRLFDGWRVERGETVSMRVQ
jgi:uncharacterized membrane protein (UPF0127 family)